ncbi:type II toxin-antitoxin system VapC family toxin [Cyanobium sp. ATX 6F1]|uniref:type II toxin-antitoxin system VapC family toxin n=1 Tax=unclassified Cyanobium TaxID=2627006 RepID=UPI0020CE15D4|nr:type II toxin-antitoxin system VapC family toxin [Cyanobium sp. ATX 6F1]MCP9916703.1 type II toxin-antitoxin system VapC family toxin [Cyanobium sp. ATX 6F1]
MKPGLLLDSCTFLWMLRTPDELSSKARDALVDPSRPLFLSVVSEWEMVLKAQAGRLPFPEPPAAYILRERLRHGIETLPLQEGALTHLSKLPDHHRDPFDRMLICQAIEHGLELVTSDRAIQLYPIRVLW